MSAHDKRARPVIESREVWTLVDELQPSGREGRDAEPGSGLRRPRPRYSWRRDRIAVALMGAISIVIILALTGALFAVVVYKQNANAPRTRIEKEIATLEDAVKTYPKSQDAWFDYSAVLIDTKQYARAEKVLDRADLATDDPPIFDVQRARILFAQGRYEKAVEDATKARTEEYALEKKKVAAANKKGYKTTVQGYVDETVINASLLIAQAEIELGDIDSAIAAYTAALGEEPKMADVLAMRGDMYEKADRFEEAAKDYRAALKYVTDLEAAKKGLARVEKEIGK
jgi:tetratricopeptide (TPR) repeat protein